MVAVTTFLVAKVWIIGKPSDEACCHIHTYSPVFPACNVCRLSSNLSHHIGKVVWPYYPRWLNSLLNYYRFCKVDAFDFNITLINT